MKTEKEKMQAGETYYAFDPELMELHRDCLKWVEEYNRTYFRDYTQGGELLRKFLPNAHPSLVIQAPFWCDFGFNIYGGENGFINYNCTILDTARIYLGKNILINCMLRCTRSIIGNAQQEPNMASPLQSAMIVG